MKIAALLESRKRLLEGGNLSVGSHEAQHLDLKVTNRNYMVPKLNELLSAINQAYAKMYKKPLWNPKVLASGEFLSGSSLHFFNVKGISDETFVAKKPTVGDIDTMVDKTKEPDLQQFLTAYTNKQIGPAKFLGFQRGNEQFSGLFELQDPPVKVQIDFEFVAFEKDVPTDWAKFSHSSSWEDLQAGVKGVFHKWLIQAFTALTRKDFILRKMKGRGKLRKEVDEPATDNMYSFAVSSKEGGGLRAKYEPVLDENGKPLVINGLPVMREAPTAGYQQNIGQIFSTILGQRLTPKQAQALQQQFWSFTGLLNVMNTLMSPEEKQLVLDGFLQKTIGPGAQGMYKNNPDKDIAEKTTAINTMLQTLKLPKPANLDKMLKDYRQTYKMTGTDEGIETRRNIVKDMAKNTLDEAAPNYKRKGIQHIYNPGSSTEMKDTDFINFCKEIAQDGGKFQGVPINLKVDGAGIRFGKTAEGKPFFMTSRVDTPMTADNIGAFEAYGRKQGQTEEQLARTQNYDKALATIVNADFMKDIPPDTIVQAEMLFNPMAQQDDGGYKFVNIPYDPKKLGKSMTLVPISVKQYSTGETSPDSQKIKQALIKDSTPDIKMINNTLSHKGIDVSKIVNPIVKNVEALSNAVAQRGDTPDKQKANAILSKARQALSNAIIKSPIEGKDQLGDMIEGLVINMPSGTLAKVTSPDMQQKMAAKQAMNKKPTEGGNRTKPAVVTIGSFVGHKGHQQLIQQTIDTAKSVGGDPYIYVSPVMGPDDPIPPQDKVKTLQKLYPQYAKNIQVWNPQGTPVKKIEKELVLPTNSPYNKIILLVGDDRYEGFKNWMDSLEKRMKDPEAIAKYGGTQNQVDFETVRTERDPSKGGTGISFTQLRNKLKEPNTSEQDKLNYWMQAFDGETLGQDWVKHLMDVTAKNMGIQQQQAIKEYIERVKVLLPHATPEQKAKIYESLVRAKAKVTESSLEEVDRRGFLKGLGAAAVAGAAGSALAAPFNHGSYKDAMTGEGGGGFSLIKSDNSNASLQISWPGSNQPGFIITIPRTVINMGVRGAGGRIKIGGKVDSIFLNPLRSNDPSSAGVLDADIARKILNTPGELLIEVPIYREGNQIYRFTVEPDAITKDFEKRQKQQDTRHRQQVEKDKVAQEKQRQDDERKGVEKEEQRLRDLETERKRREEEMRPEMERQEKVRKIESDLYQYNKQISANILNNFRQILGNKLKDISNVQNVDVTIQVDKNGNISNVNVGPNAHAEKLFGWGGVSSSDKVRMGKDAYDLLKNPKFYNGLFANIPPDLFQAAMDENGLMTINLNLGDAGYNSQNKLGGKITIPKLRELGVRSNYNVNEGVEQSVTGDKDSDPVTDAVISFYKPVVNDIHKEKVDNYVDQARELLQKTDDPKVRSKLIDIFKKGKENPYIQGGIVTTIGALLAGGILTTAQRMGLSPSQTNLALQAILNTVIPTVVSRINGKNWSDTIKYTLASAGIGTGIAAITEKETGGSLGLPFPGTYEQEKVTESADYLEEK